MTLKLNGSSSGSVSIDAPASTTGGADLAYTLPDATTGGIIRTTTTPGAILQVASTTKSDSNAEVDCADGAWLTVSGLTVSMAATEASNNILITGIFSVAMSYDERIF